MYKKALLIVSLVLFVVCAYFFRHYLSIFYFQNDINKVVINIESQKQGEVWACFNKNCDLMEFKNGIYSYKLNQQNPIFYNSIVKELEIITKNKDMISSFKDVLMFNGSKFEPLKIKDVKNIEFNQDKAYGTTFKINNDKPFYQKMGVYIESIFYNWYFYILSYALILICLIKYQQRFDFKIKYPLFLILFLGLFLRLSHITFIPLWNDELYTLCFISDMGESINLKRTILDPGNPPLFFMISNIWLYFFHKNLFLIRLLPCLIGMVEIYTIYFALNKIFNRKVALIAAFLSAINIFIIFESNEIRSYILSMTLILVAFYWFYKLKNNFSYFNLLVYCFVSILLINLHYYCIFYVLGNFILGFILFKKHRLKFLIANFCAFLSFVPYFQITVMYKSFCSNFNTWLEKPTIGVIYNHIVFYFGNVFFFVLVILFSLFIVKKLQKNEKFVFLYNIYSISFVFIFAFLISIFIKPILFERYFCIFLPFLIINTSLVLNIDFKTKFQPLICFVLFLFSIGIPKYENFNLFSNIDLMTKYASFDYKNQKDDWDYYFVVPDMSHYLRYYKEIPFEKIIVSNYGVREDVDLIEFYLSKIKKDKNKKGIVLYLPEICINSKIKYSKELNIKQINTTMVPLYKIYIK